MALNLGTAELIRAKLKNMHKNPQVKLRPADTEGIYYVTLRDSQKETGLVRTSKANAFFHRTVSIHMHLVCLGAVLVDKPAGFYRPLNQTSKGLALNRDHSDLA